VNRTAVCTVKILFWYSVLPTVFQIDCHRCKRMIGTFSQHESAMAWAQAHAASSKHIEGR